MKKKSLRNNTFAEKIGWLSLLLIIWQLIAKSGQIDPILFPSLEEIFAALILSFTKGRLFFELFFSLSIIVEGILIGGLLALSMTFISLKSRIFDSFSQSLTSIMHPIPGVALLPIVILWIGTGRNAVLFIIVHSVLWPMLINLRSGISAMQPIHEEVAKLMNLSGRRLFKDIYLPSSLSYTIAGLKIAWSRAWRALISAEMIFGAAGGRGGIGWFMLQKRVFMDTAGMMAGLLLIILVGILVEEVFFEWLENKTIRKWGMSQ